jgi:hypothetical protein
MGRSLSIIMLCILNSTINKAGSTGPSFVTPGLLFSCVVSFQLAQNSAAQLARGCTWRANNNNMHVNLSWFKVEEKFTSSLLVSGIDMLNAPCCLFEPLAYSSDTHAYPTRHATRGFFTGHKSRPDYGGAQYYIEPWLHGTLFHVR